MKARPPMLRPLSACALLAAALQAPAAIVESDICIYGGTSGGVIAAVQAARMGKSVVLVEPGRRVGGMTSGGLGRTDTGVTATIGGLAREFYRLVGRRYGLHESFTFEPHVAEQVLLEMLREAGVPVYVDQRLASVTKTDLSIAAMIMESGDEFRAKMYLDTTYEGDLMAMAGVSFTVGRESASAYGESLNGIRAVTPAHQFVLPVDPYVTPGDPNSGLLPFVQTDGGGTPGEGDHRVQAYNFRLCLTQVETNRMPIDPPPGYNAAQYELLGRYIQARVDAGHALTLATFLNIANMPNGKTDANNNGAFSTDAIGMNYTYPTNSSAGRAAIRQAHEDYTRGFLHFLATDARVPLAVRTSMQSWGLCRDEFTETAGWPHQLYVREARRMLSPYIMIQAHCAGTIVATDSVGLASYNMDSHNCQRFVSGGAVTNEGDVQQTPAGPFPIAYRSIVPPGSECDNLLVTFCLSASHIAFSSCRMEPVFMMTSQSAAAAASFAIDDGLPVQDVPYDKLRLQLFADRQVLQWTAGTGDTNSVILDSEQDVGVTRTGSWSASTSQAGYIGSNYLHDQNADKGMKSVLFTPDLPAAGDYIVYLRWTTNANRATNVPITLTYSGGVTNLAVNQRLSNGVWVALATLPFNAGTTGSLLVETTGTDGYVIADGSRWSRVVPTPPPVVEAIATDPSATEDGFNPAVFTVVRTGDSSNDLAVAYTIGGTAAAGADYPALPGSLVIPAGQSTATITVRPLPDDLPENDESISIALHPGSDYQLGAYTNASAVLRDGGFGAWRADHFTTAELADENISGKTADPDGDRQPNLLECFHGSDPLSSNAVQSLRLVTDSNGWALAWRRAAAASDLFLRVENTPDLSQWSPAPFSAQAPSVSNTPAFQELRFPLGFPPDTSSRTCYRVRVSQTPLTLASGTAHFFFSFDTATDGTGPFSAGVTSVDGFTGTPSLQTIGTVFTEAGGAAEFTDFNGITWLGSGSSTAPGHCLAFNPGSTGNLLRLTFSTRGLRQIRVRMDARSAAQAGGAAPTEFASFTYDTGGGPQPVPGIDLTLTPDNAFHEWSADLSALTALDNQHSVTLAWTFKNLTSSPQVSLRIDNIQVSAEPAAEP